MIHSLTSESKNALPTLFQAPLRRSDARLNQGDCQLKGDRIFGAIS
jgi:hypothetical protein